MLAFALQIKTWTCRDWAEEAAFWSRLGEEAALWSWREEGLAITFKMVML